MQDWSYAKEILYPSGEPHRSARIRQQEPLNATGRDWLRWLTVWQHGRVVEMKGGVATLRWPNNLRHPQGTWNLSQVCESGRAE